MKKRLPNNGFIPGNNQLPKGFDFGIPIKIGVVRLVSVRDFGKWNEVSGSYKKQDYQRKK